MFNSKTTLCESASPLDQGERIKVRGYICFNNANPHLDLSLVKGEANECTNKYWSYVNRL
jgi:hypothetical protein